MPDGSWMTAKDPVYFEMERFARTAEGITLAVQAANHGEPAAGAFDAFFRSTIGKAYINDESSTLNCGFVVKELMENLGFVKAGRGACSHNGGMKTGLLWVMPQKSMSASP